jgi:hypothetical protein
MIEAKVMPQPRGRKAQRFSKYSTKTEPDL